MTVPTSPASAAGQAPPPDAVTRPYPSATGSNVRGALMHPPSLAAITAPGQRHAPHSIAKVEVPPGASVRSGPSTSASMWNMSLPS